MRRYGAFPGVWTPEKLGPGGEFLDRDPQLPADPRFSDTAREGYLTGQMIDTPPGEPPIDYDVRSVYDSRPINGLDFNFTASQAIGSATAWTLEYQVPQGYVAVLKGARHFLDPLPSSLDSYNDVLATLLIGGVQIPSNQDIPVGIQSDSLLKFFYIYDEYQKMGLLLEPSVVPLNTTAYVVFYGNLLSKTGRPIAFEIANPVPFPKKKR